MTMRYKNLASRSSRLCGSWRQKDEEGTKHMKSALPVTFIEPKDNNEDIKVVPCQLRVHGCVRGCRKKNYRASHVVSRPSVRGVSPKTPPIQKFLAQTPKRAQANNVQSSNVDHGIYIRTLSDSVLMME